MMEKIRCRDKLEEMRDREKRRGVRGEIRGREKKNEKREGCEKMMRDREKGGRWFRTFRSMEHELNK